MVVFLFVIAVVVSQSISGDFYDVPAYFGHFSRRYFEPSFLLNGSLTRVQFHFAVDAAYDNQTIFFADPLEHCVLSYSKSSGVLSTLTGQCGYPGNVVGYQSLAKFNGVSSVAYYQTASANLTALLSSDRLVLVANASCDISSAGCLLSQPYPLLQMQNIRLVSNVSLYEDEPGQEQFLYLADTNNHCIKRLSLSQSSVQVVAGECGEAGFLDGPMGYNRLNKPTNMGVSRSGVLYFFDSGNQYIRIVDLLGNVDSLQLGACKELDQGRVVFGYQLRKMLCFENWIQGMTQSATNHYFDPSILKICTSQSSHCGYQ